MTSKNLNIPIDTSITTRVMDAKGVVRRTGAPDQWMVINSIRFSSANEPFFSSCVFMNNNSLWMNVYESSYTSGTMTVEYNISVDYLE